ncbi:MAG: Crp/Fnr family transcriptional regulator [Anaerolineales bacterium]
MLSTDIVDGFKRAGIPRNYAAGEPLVLVNEPSTGMYLILEGTAKVYRRDLEGQQIEVATLGPSQTMGEISLLLGQPHSATVVAETEMDCLLLTRNRLEELKLEDPELALKLYEILSYSLSRYVMFTNQQLDQARKHIHRLEQRLTEQDPTSFSYF